MQGGAGVRPCVRLWGIYHGHSALCFAVACLQTWLKFFQLLHLKYSIEFKSKFAH